MNINKELDRIRDKGFEIVMVWGRSVSFIDHTKKQRLPFKTLVVRKLEAEQWEHCIYRSVLEFDEKHPKIL